MKFNSNKLTPQNGSVLLIIGIMLVAMNLRAPVMGIAPLIEIISQSLNLSATQAGLLTTLPLIGFALFAPPSAFLAKTLGVERSIFLALIIIAIGLFIRSLGSFNGLFFGTILVGIGTSIGNVLLPIVVKRDFPLKIAMMTSCYVLAMGIASGSYSALAVPLVGFMQLGWQGSLLSLILITFVSIIIWLPQLKRNKKTISTLINSSDASTELKHKNIKPSAHKLTNLWRKGLAWQISLYLGLGSFFSYTILAWMPNYLIASGYSAEKSGVIHALFQIGSALPGIVIIPLVAKLKDQRWLAFSICITTAICLFGLIHFVQIAAIWSFTLGVCSGGWFILGLSFVGLRTQDPSHTTTLSGMAQFIGYGVAAVGPMLAGYLFEITQSWHSMLYMIICICFIAAVIGFSSGRNITIE